MYGEVVEGENLDSFDIFEGVKKVGKCLNVFGGIGVAWDKDVADPHLFFAMIETLCKIQHGLEFASGESLVFQRVHLFDIQKNEVDYIKPAIG